MMLEGEKIANVYALKKKAAQKEAYIESFKRPLETCEWTFRLKINQVRGQVTGFRRLYESTACDHWTSVSSLVLITLLLWFILSKQGSIGVIEWNIDEKTIWAPAHNLHLFALVFEIFFLLNFCHYCMENKISALQWDLVCMCMDSFTISDTNDFSLVQKD